MADLGSGLKSMFMKGMESIGNAAASIASNTKSKVDEMNMVNRRTEILADFGNRAYGLWLKGESFPPELDSLLKELKDLDERLNDLRAEKYANIKKKAEEKAPVIQMPPEEEAPEAPAEEPEEAPAEEVPVIRVEKEGDAPEASTPVNDAIEDLFSQVPDGNQVRDKVNDALDSLEDGLGQLSGEIDEGLEKLSDKIKGGDK